MSDFIDWCAMNDNIFLNFFAFISFILCASFIFLLTGFLLLVYPLLGIPAFFGVWYLIWRKYKGETEQ